MKTFKNGDVLAIEGKGTVQKELPTTPTHHYHSQTRRAYIFQHTTGIVVNKRGKGKVLAKRTNVSIENITHSKGDNTS
jgi:ribosomal protein L21E